MNDLKFVNSLADYLISRYDVKAPAIAAGNAAVCGVDDREMNAYWNLVRVRAEVMLQANNAIRG